MSAIWPASATAPDPTFVALACEWMTDSGARMLDFVWLGYDSLCQNPPIIEGKDLERSITQVLIRRIDQAMSGDEPFYILHGAFEHATMAAPPAQPPAYDMAFVLQADERIMWPLEAKVLETPKRVASYVRDVEEQFLTCRYAPFSGSGAMLGYLLAGTTDDTLTNIAKGLGCALTPLATPSLRAHATSCHQRTAPQGKSWPTEFVCHHLIMGFHGLQRTAAMRMAP
jgi:hypothetical protein